jgi:hypothetical protein
MLNSKKVVGFAIATAAAGLFAASATNTAMAASHSGGAAKVHCTGANACKGKSECQTSSNSCKGQNACKGKGWVSSASDKECADKGGKAEAKKG